MRLVLLKEVWGREERVGLGLKGREGRVGVG